MLNKGLHSERQVKSRKSQVESTYDLLLATHDYTNPQKDFAYGENQTEFEKEQLALTMSYCSSFLHLTEEKYPDIYRREEGESHSQMQTNRRLLVLPPWGELEGGSNLTTSSFTKEGTIFNNLKLKLTKDDLYNNKTTKRKSGQEKHNSAFRTGTPGKRGTNIY